MFVSKQRNEDDQARDGFGSPGVSPERSSMPSRTVLIDEPTPSDALATWSSHLSMLYRLPLDTSLTKWHRDGRCTYDLRRI